MKMALVVLLLAVSCATGSATASSYSTDFSDLWWNPNESGWGVQLVQRNSTIFATMFIYGPSGTPTWYVATMTPTSSGGLVWSGPLYATTGPYFGGAFNPSQVQVTQVGSMAWNPTDVEDGVLTYSVNGVQVAKNVTRQTLVAENFNTHIAGGIHSSISGCSNPAFNGVRETPSNLTILQSGLSLSMQAVSTAATCSYAGTLSQFGQMASIDGTFSCTDGSQGAFHAFEMQINAVGITARFTSQYSNPPGCQGAGWFGGVASTQF